MAKKQLHKAVADGVKVYCNYDEIVSVTDLKPNPENPNRHPAEQIELLAKIIQKNGWRERIIVSTLSGMIVKGHGRYQAAILAALSQVPVEYQHYETKADEVKDLIADNKIAELSIIDNKIAAELMKKIMGSDEDFLTDLAYYGYKDSELKELFPDIEVDSDENYLEGYSQKIKSPIYEPKEEKPLIKDLFDDSKSQELINEIEGSNLPGDIKNFLVMAAGRHTVFNYGRVAEYYAHAEADVQALMENSGLIIIDFKRAIELGYVKLSEEIGKQYGIDYPDA